MSKDQDIRQVSYEEALAILGDSSDLMRHDDGNVLRYAGEGCCGAVSLLYGGRTARLRSIFVRPELRGQGIGTRLTEHLISIASQLSVRRIDVITYNPAFYAERGFVERRKQSYKGKDVWVMEMTLHGRRH